MQNSSIRVLALAVATVCSLAAGCGGGSSGGGTSGPETSTPSKESTAGIYKGSVTSTTTGQTTSVVAMVRPDGQTAWMGTDGRVWSGSMPTTGTRFDVSLMGHMYAGATFPDGSNAGTWTMHVDHATGQMSGAFDGSGDAGNFNLMRSSMWSRPASLSTLAGVYTRSTWSGYAMTMSIGADGQFTASDSRGCVINGLVAVPDASRNLYAINGTVTSCGTLNGTYAGMGTLVDADAMRDWMIAMHPLEQGGHTHGSVGMGGSMGGGMGGMTYNTVPSGTSNLLMFVLRNEQNAIMDALAK